MVLILAMLVMLLDSTFFLAAHVAERSSFPKPMTKAEEAEAIARMRAGDASAANELVERNLRLVAHIAKKYIHADVEQEDLVSIGAIGLMKAVASFKPEAGRLASYASRCVENEILMALRASKKRRANCSLSEPIGADAEGNEIMLADILGTEPDMIAKLAEQRIEGGRIAALMGAVLEPRERTVLSLRFGLIDGEPRAQHEIAEALRISRSYVSRIEKRALEKLRQAAGA